LEFALGLQEGDGQHGTIEPGFYSRTRSVSMKLTLQNKIKGGAGLVLLAYIAFIALGMPDGLLGVGWPSMRTDFSIPLDAMGMLLIAGMVGYLTSSFLNGKLLARLGVGKLLAASCALTGSALIGYTLVPSWWMMVALGVFSGLGAGGIDAGLNTYVASNFGEGLMQWLHASYGIGVTLGPIIMTTALAAGRSWRVGYAIVGIFQIILALIFGFTLARWKEKAPPSQDGSRKLTDYKTPLFETLKQPRVWLSQSLFLIYTGVEISIGTWAYTLLTESRGIAPEIAGLWAGSYYATFTIGRILAGIYTKKVGGHTLIFGSLAGALLGIILLWWNPSPAISLTGVALTGFAVAPIFPAMVSGTSRRVGARFAANTIGMQMAAAGLGGSLIPGLVGVLAKRISLEVIPVCLFVLIIALMGLFALSILKKPPVHEKDQAG
jgi:fucose permease